jgi:hypothetical protein
MAQRKTKRTAAPAPARRKTARARSAPDLTPEEVAELELQAVRQKRMERSWLSMTDTRVEEDPWNDVQEHLLIKNSGREHSLRRWKYFSK